MSASRFDWSGSPFDKLASMATPSTGTSRTVITRRMTPDQLAEYRRTGTMPVSTDVPIISTETIEPQQPRYSFNDWQPRHTGAASPS